jgi:2-polyprenyl-3-methyl-5-hydroxy-6-metoxy-1,4-benzoquinol methylase
MKRLTDESYWNSVHAVQPGNSAPSPTRLRRWLRRIGRSYAAEKILSFLSQYFRPGPLRVIEIGSAPGEFLKECHARFGFDPYGVEYSSVGARVNQQNFRSWGLDPNHVYQADFFADDFQLAHRAQFDVVVSRGFIEHFTDLRPVIDAHMNLLKPEGVLVIIIPNLSGLNYMLGWLLIRDLYPLHNLNLMRKDAFGSIFTRADLYILFCGYVGGIDLGIIDRGSDHFVYRVNRLIQWGLNVVFNAFSMHVPETRYTSPYLLYIGRKRAA